MLFLQPGVCFCERLMDGRLGKFRVSMCQVLVFGIFHRFDRAAHVRITLGRAADTFSDISGKIFESSAFVAKASKSMNF